MLLTESLRVDGYDETVKTAVEIGRKMKMGFILRIQDKKETSFNVNNGETEEVSTTSLRGMGFQVFTPEGYTGFASSDHIHPSIVEDLAKQAAKLAEKVRELGGETNPAVFNVPAGSRRVVLPLKYPYGSCSLGEMEERLKKLNKKLGFEDSRLSVRTVHRVVDEEWRVARHDGTNTSFMMPRSFIYNIFTAREDGKTATTYSNLPGTDLSILLEPAEIARLNKISYRAATTASALLTAGTVKGGSYKLVIDYALAKGLAHEAFGHAAETDGMESSILGENGRLCQGKEVASPIVSIIDGPVEGDYAYQPVSANGIDRRSVRIVEDGILRAGLADLFSAEAAGVPVTGAGRAESCHHLPLARMSNIRIQVKDPYPVEEDFADITPERLYKIMLQSELMKEDEEVFYLSGFQGGQVNPAQGNFVFNCLAIYRLGPVCRLYRPAIFAGKILTALRAVRAGIGPLKIDAMGTCGKMFQGVPSSGGSHYFLVLDKNPEIVIGGEAG